MEGQASLHWSRHKFRKWQEECKWKVKDRRGKQRKCSLFVFFNVVAENIGNIPTKSSLSQGTVFSYAGASVRNMLCGFVFAFQRIYINRLFKKKKKRHDIVSPNSWAKDYDFKIYRRWFRNCDSIFFHLMMLLFLYMMLLLIFFSWAWTTELELTKMWLNSLSLLSSNSEWIGSIPTQLLCADFHSWRKAILFPAASYCAPLSSIDYEEMFIWEFMCAVNFYHTFFCTTSSCKYSMWNQPFKSLYWQPTVADSGGISLPAGDYGCQCHILPTLSRESRPVTALSVAP